MKKVYLYYFLAFVAAVITFVVVAGANILYLFVGIPLFKMFIVDFLK